MKRKLDKNRKFPIPYAPINVVKTYAKCIPITEITVFGGICLIKDSVFNKLKVSSPKTLSCSAYSYFWY